MKKLAALLICGITLTITACGNEATAPAEAPAIEKEAIADTTEDTAEAAEAEEATPASIADIEKEIESSVSLVAPMAMSDDFIFNYYGIDTSSLAEYSFVMSEEATSAETIIIIKVADGSTDQVKGQLQAILDEKAMEMEDYLPEEYEIVKKASVTVKGDYVYLVISNSASEIQSIIDKYI